MDEQLSELKKGLYMGYCSSDLYMGLINNNEEINERCKHILYSALDELEKIEKNSEKYVLLNKWVNDVKHIISSVFKNN